MIQTIVPFAIVAAMLVWLVVRARRSDWRCDRCEHTFSVSPLMGTLMPHSLSGRKLLRCPACGAWCWASRVPKRSA